MIFEGSFAANCKHFWWYLKISWAINSKMVGAIFSGWWGRNTHSKTCKGSDHWVSHCPMIAVGWKSTMKINTVIHILGYIQWTYLFVTDCPAISKADFASGINFLGEFISGSAFRMLNKDANCNVVTPRYSLIQFMVPQSFVHYLKVVFLLRVELFVAVWTDLWFWVQDICRVVIALFLVPLAAWMFFMLTSGLIDLMKDLFWLGLLLKYHSYKGRRTSPEIVPWLVIMSEPCTSDELWGCFSFLVAKLSIDNTPLMQRY